MSRYEIQDSRGRDAVVGWDPPLQTFFLQGDFIGEDGREREVPGIWIGGFPEEISTVETLSDVIHEKLGVDLPPTLRDQLMQDQILSEPQTESQRAAISWLDQLFQQIDEADDEYEPGE